MDMRGYQRYREDALNTMTPGELLLLVYDELIKRLTQAELALSKEDYPALEAAVDHSMKIIHYLDDTLDRQYPISSQLTRLYEYFCYELCRVKSGRNKTELERVKRMAGELRDSFRQAEKHESGR
jgi:flagellar protein FliS